MRKRLKVDVRFGTPVCLCRKEEDGTFKMWTVSGTVSGLTETAPYLVQSDFIGRFSSAEEAELAASVRGMPFMAFENTGRCVSEDPAVVGFVGRWNPDVVEDGKDS